MIEGDEAASRCQRQPVSHNGAVRLEGGDAENDRKREHEGALKPAEVARRLAHDLADKENGEARQERNRPCRAERPPFMRREKRKARYRRPPLTWASVGAAGLAACCIWT